MTFLFSGIVFGLSAGLAPGPLLTLVVSETIKYGTKEGMKVAIAPLVTDLPIVLAAILVLSRLSDIQPIFGIVSLLGAAFLFYLGYENLTFKGVDIEDNLVKPQSLKKAVVTNFLSPHPYMFWLSIGAPTVLKASEIHVSFAVVFVSAFYLLLIGSKLFVAIIIGKSRTILKTRGYIYSIKSLGIILFMFAVLFLRDGLKTFGVI